MFYPVLTLNISHDLELEDGYSFPVKIPKVYGYYSWELLPEISWMPSYVSLKPTMTSQVKQKAY